MIYLYDTLAVMYFRYDVTTVLLPRYINSNARSSFESSAIRTPSVNGSGSGTLT